MAETSRPPSPRPEWFKSVAEADDENSTAPARLPWSTPVVTHTPEAWSVEATFAGAGCVPPIPTAQFNQGRRLWDNPGGRQPNFDEAAVVRMMIKFEAFCLQEQATPGRLPVEKRIKNFVMEKLLPAEGVTSSYNIARKQIVAPVLRRLRPQRRKNKFD
jgi:hypothetical protein